MKQVNMLEKKIEKLWQSLPEVEFLVESFEKLIQDKDFIAKVDPDRLLKTYNFIFNLYHKILDNYRKIKILGTPDDENLKLASLINALESEDRIKVIKFIRSKVGGTDE